MKSIAIFLLLAFATGFQAAVLSEEPPSPISAPNPNFLERVQDQIGDFSTSVVETVNEHLGTMKQHVFEILTDVKKNYNKVVTRKIGNQLKEFQQSTQSAYNQGVEMMNDKYKKTTEMVEEMKNHPTMVVMNEEMLEPLWRKCAQLASWLSDQSIATLMQKVKKNAELLKSSIMDTQSSDSVGVGQGKLKKSG